MFQTYIEKLKKGLKKPLPGKEAHQKMLPVSTDNVRAGNKNQEIKQGSVLILLYPKKDKVYIPLMQRPDYNGAHGGQISFPGGKREKQDKDLIATAIREAEEEIGVDAKDISVLGTLTELYIYASNFTVVPVVAFTSSAPLFIPNPYEVEEIIEASFEDLLEERTVKTTTLKVRGFELKAPYFDINGKVVWGATAMILSEFIALLRSEV